MSDIKPPLNLLIDIQSWKESTATLTATERGAFLSLQMFYWRTGPIPDHDQTIAQITGMELKDWKKARKALEGMFIVDAGEWFRSDWNEELEAAYRAVTKAKEKGRRAATVRWDRQKGAKKGYSEHAPSTPHGCKENAPELVKYTGAVKGKIPSQQKEVFDYDDPAIEKAVSGLGAGRKDQSFIMARGVGVANLGTEVQHGL